MADESQHAQDTKTVHDNMYINVIYLKHVYIDTHIYTVFPRISACPLLYLLIKKITFMMYMNEITSPMQCICTVTVIWHLVLKQAYRMDRSNEKITSFGFFR